jgi:hypothetical protein
VNQHARYRVIGKRAYRDHPPGTTFDARLDRHAEHRAIQRGDIVFVRVVHPELQDGSFTFPHGWLAGHPTT